MEKELLKELEIYKNALKNCKCDIEKVIFEFEISCVQKDISKLQNKTVKE